MQADAVALLYSLLGGIFMGSYPAPIKTPSVLAAKVHPLIFQCYKSFWVFIFGWGCVVVNALSHGELTYDFTWWGVLSAAAWIPSGLGTIAAVPRLGVGMAIVINTGLSSTLSFLVFWLVLGESMQKHIIDGKTVYLAPAYLLCTVLGMAALVAAPRAKCCSRRAPAVREIEQSGMQAPPAGRSASPGVAPSAGGAAAARGEDESVPLASCDQDSTASLVEESVNTITTGLLCAFAAGAFSAAQYGTVTVGKKQAQEADGCAGAADSCSARLKEQFNVFGSWTASFGVGAMGITVVLVMAWLASERLQGRPKPDFQFQTLVVPGSIAGLCWSLGNFFQTAAILRGGSAVMMPANQACQLIVSGLWGLLYYGEVRGRTRICLWVAAAAWTLVFIVLLSREKSGS